MSQIFGNTGIDNTQQIESDGVNKDGFPAQPSGGGSNLEDGGPDTKGRRRLPPNRICGSDLKDGGGDP